MTSRETGPVAGETTAAVMTVAAGALLGLALQMRSGRLDPVAITLVAAALVALVLAVRGRPWGLIEGPGGSHVGGAGSGGGPGGGALQQPQLGEHGRDVDGGQRGSRALGCALVGALLATLIAHLPRPPGIHLDVAGFGGRAFFLVGLGLASAVVASAFRRGPAANVEAGNAPRANEADAAEDAGGRWRAVLLIAIFLVLGAWVIRHSPDPQIDVFIFQRDSAAALLAGENPYRLTFPNIYGHGHYYGPGLVVDGRLQFGFPYPPLTLLLALPGALAGDFRYSQLAAMAVAGGIMTVLGRGRLGLSAAALYLFSPRTFFVLEQGWTEPYLVALAAFVLLAATRARALLPVALGLFIASKQYLVVALPLVPWLERRARPLALAALVAAAVTLPFALWDLPAFWHSVAALQFGQPFRDDALSFLAVVAYVTGFRPPSGLALVAAVAALVLCFRRLPRSPHGFALALALSFFAFFAFNKQAFCNYYHFVVGAIALAVATGSAGWGSRR